MTLAKAQRTQSVEVVLLNILSVRIYAIFLFMRQEFGDLEELLKS